MEGYPVTVGFPMHWGEMDALGHANNARYFTWFESARIAFFREVGLEAEVGTKVGPILKRTEAEFLRPVHFPAELLVGARVPKVGNTSFTMEYALVSRDAPERLLARGSAVVVLVDYATGEKVPIPDALRAALTGG